MKRKGTRQIVKGKLYGRFRFGDGRHSIPMPGVSVRDEKAITARCELIADTVARLVAAGYLERARDIAEQIGAATSQKRLDAIERGVAQLIEAATPHAGGLTVRQFGEKWTSGALAREYPDHVKVKGSAQDDKELLEQYVYPVMGSVPVRGVQLADGERMMARIPAKRSRARRRHVAQVLHRLLNLAVYPAKLIPANPLPRGFLPKLGPPRAKGYLYPDEDAKLLGAVRVPLVYRLLYGVMDREGLRLSEALNLEHADLDLDRGVIRLDENKTDDPRSWALDPSVAAALRRWKEMRPKALRPFEDASEAHAAHRFRETHLRLAGVERAELFVSTEARRRIVVHDLRATFVTISLANGRTETWVQDRTGHKSTHMIMKYRRAARTVAELNLGPLSPLDEALVWHEDLSGQEEVKQVSGSGDPVATTKARKNKRSTEGGTRTLTSLRTADFECEATTPGASEGSEKSGSDDPSSPARGALDRGLTDLQAIRSEWSTIEVAVERMADSEGAQGNGLAPEDEP